jgi:hypothetical protein
VTVWDVLCANQDARPDTADLSDALGTTIALLEWLTYRGTVVRSVEGDRPVFRPAPGSGRAP